jgi:8-oxo-dGTP pyrophosphatase MutT (NUDIX family)
MAEILHGDRIGASATLKVGCAAVVFDDDRQSVLLTQRTDNGLWCLPGGAMDPGESAAEACCREVREETGLLVEVMRLVGVYSSPHRVTRYADGNTHQVVALCFEATVIGGALGLSNETTDVGWFTAPQMNDLEVMSNHDERVRDAWRNDVRTVIG